MNAISLRSTGYNILHLGAPALAGVLIDKIGFEYVYYINSGLSTAALVLTLFLPFTGTWERKGGNLFSQMREGLKYVRTETGILFILILTMLSTFLGTSYFKLLPIFVDDILKVGATGMGVLLSVSAAGALVSSLATASLPSRKRGAMMLASATLLGLALVSFAFSPSWHLSLVFILLIGLARSARTTLANTLLQSYTAANYRGRVTSLYSMEEGVMSLGSFIIAMIAEATGVSWAVGNFASALVLISLLAMVFLPRVRKLE